MTITMPALVVYGRSHTARRSAVIRKAFMLQRVVTHRLRPDVRQSDLVPGTLYVAEGIPPIACRQLRYSEAYRLAKGNAFANLKDTPE